MIRSESGCTMIAIKQGDLFWYTEESHEGSIPHPYVIIQVPTSTANIKESVVICGLTTNMKKVSWPGNIPLDLHEGNLHKPSIVDVSKTLVVDPSQLGEFIGTLSQSRMEQIISGMKLTQNLQN